MRRLLDETRSRSTGDIVADHLKILAASAVLLLLASLL